MDHEMRDRLHEKLRQNALEMYELDQEILRLKAELEKYKAKEAREAEELDDMLVDMAAQFSG